MPFTIRDLVDPYAGQAVPSKPDSWSELDQEMERQKALGPQDAPPPANVPAPPTEASTWIKRMEQIRPNRYFEAESNNSTWMPKELEGVPRNSPTWTMPGEKKPWGPAESPAPSGDQPTDHPTPDYVPTALQQYQAPGGATYTTDDSVGPRFQGFLQALKDRYGYVPQEVQGHNPRNIAGSNTPSNHWSGPGRGAIDIDPNAHPEGVAGTWGNIPIIALAREFGLRSGEDFKRAKGPDGMHVEATGVSMAGVPAPQSGGTAKMAGIGELVDPETGQVLNAEQQVRPRLAARAVEAANAGSGGQSPAPYSSWDQFGQEAMNKNAALSFAAQMMMPSYYGFGGQLAESLGRAGESRAATAAALQKTLGGEIGADEKAAEAEAGRQSREQNAETAASSREAVANIRGQFSLDRAHIALQKAPASVYVKYYDQARKTVENNIGNMTLDDSTKTALIRQKAAELYQAAVELGLEKGGGEGIGGAPSSATAGPGGQAPGGSPPTAGAGKNSSAKVSWEQYKAKPGVAEAIQNPAFREKLFAERPDFRAAWSRETGDTNATFGFRMAP